MRLVLLGGGGFAKEVLEIADLLGHRVVGYLATAPGAIPLPHLGTFDDLPALRERFEGVALAFGAVDRAAAARRAEVARMVGAGGFHAPPLVSPHAVSSRGAQVADGAIVAHRAVLSVDCRVGRFAVVNTGAIIGHDAVVDENVTIAPAAFLAGAVRVGAGSLVGPHASILGGRSIGRDVVVGLAATVVRDVPDRATVLPVRSRVLRDDELVEAAT